MSSRVWNPFVARRGREAVTAPVDGALVQQRASYLEQALALGEKEIPTDDVERTRRLLVKAKQRSGLGAGHTVVALAGATGSGKSSLFNALVGADVAQVGVTRPTTSRAGAASWGQTPHELLDWIGVAGRHEVSPNAPGFTELEGLVLLDLPDIDSRVSTNRAEADRVLELCDVFVWVTDPQKYADALLHEEYVRQFASTKAAAVVVLNQIDRLRDGDAAQCLADLASLLQHDGLVDARVVPASTVARSGGQQVMEALADIVRTHNAADRRLMGDLTVAAQQLSNYVAAPRPERRPRVDAELVGALAQAAGVGTVLDAVERNYRRDATARTGWPLTRWVHKARPAPLSRLGLDKAAEKATSRRERSVVLGRSSLPPASASAKAAVELATRRMSERSSEGLPTRWAEEIHDAVDAKDTDLADALDQAVMSTSLSERSPRWWAVGSAVQWAVAVIAVSGLLWLVALAGLASVQIHLNAPTFGDWLPIPLVMLVGGLVCGLALSWIGRQMAIRGATQMRKKVQARLEHAIEEVAVERVTAPVTAILDRHDECAKALAKAAE